MEHFFSPVAHATRTSRRFNCRRFFCPASGAAATCGHCLAHCWRRKHPEKKLDAAASPKADHEPIGEVWLTGENCRVATGSFAGRPLGEVWRELPQEFTGSRPFGAPRIPLLVKFIFPEDKLSVQVHPNDEYAREHEAAAGGMGKTEMWYAVSVRAGAELRLGLEPGVTPEKFRQAIADGTAEQCMRRFAVNPGDAFFVPAGTAHMIGPGMVLCEVQQHSDLTYRVFDYNRVQADGKPRPLHIRQAFEVMNFGEQFGGLAEPVRLRRGALWLNIWWSAPTLPWSAGNSRSRLRARHLPVLSGCSSCWPARGELSGGLKAFRTGQRSFSFCRPASGSYRILPESGPGRCVDLSPAFIDGFTIGIGIEDGFTAELRSRSGRFRSISRRAGS